MYAGRQWEVSEVIYGSAKDERVALITEEQNMNTQPEMQKDAKKRGKLAALVVESGKKTSKRDRENGETRGGL